MPDTHLILHVKGTEKATTTLPKEVVRAAISQGQITHSQLIWSPAENAWKQVRELPDLLPSQKLAPAPMARATGPLPERAIPTAATQTGGIPKPAATTPQVRQTGPVPKMVGQKPAMKATARVGGQATQAGVQMRKTQSLSHVVHEKHTSHPMKWVCIIAGLLVLAGLGTNYFMVDQPLTSRLGRTSFSKVPVFGHLAGFIEPGVVLIHIPLTDTVTKDNLPDFLVALAGSTPASPLGSTFDHVDLTPNWTALYSFTGESWKQLGEMEQDETLRKDFILDHLSDASGKPMITAKPNWSDTAKAEQREKVWATFVAQFTRP